MSLTPSPGGMLAIRGDWPGTFFVPCAPIEQRKSARTPGAKPATVHPTHSFALMHAAIYDAVNAIDRTHARYLVHVHAASRSASKEAAAASAAHDVLSSLYPSLAAQLDAQL